LEPRPTAAPEFLSADRTRLGGGMPGLQIRVGKLGTQLRRSAVRGLEWGTKKSRRVLEEEEQTRMLFLRRERSEKGSGSDGDIEEILGWSVRDHRLSFGSSPSETVLMSMSLFCLRLGGKPR
jgi:hypothetical protein